MTKYSFVLLTGDKDKFLEDIRRLGVVDITRSTKPVDDRSAAMLEEAGRVRKALGLIANADFGADSDREAVAAASAEAVSGFSSVEEKVRSAIEASEKIELLKSELQVIKREELARMPWGAFDRKMIDALAEAGHIVRFYVTPRKKFSSEWAEMVPLQVISETKDSVWFVTVAPSDEEYSFPVAESSAPAGSWEDCEAEMKPVKEQLIFQKAVLQGLKNSTGELEAESDRILGDLDMYLAKSSGKLSSENLITAYEGFAPVEDDAKLDAEFDKMDVYWCSEAAVTEDNPPIRLHNNRFVKMFEVLTDMYGRPGYDGFDPTPFISIFFMLFFAFCMGDAGYGLILIAIGFFLKKVKSFASMSPLVITLGVATVVIGIIFHTFFSVDISTWKCVPQWLKSIMVPSMIAGYDGTMVLAIVVGIIHLSLAMIVKTVMATKNSGFLNSLGTWGWTLFLVGSVAAGAFALAGVLDINAVKWMIIVLGCISAVGIFLLNDIHRNPLINIGAGLWDTYNMATGVLGDVLSYLRLYALGLAGGMLGYAFNNMAYGFIADGAGVLNWIPFILVVVIGHTLNIAMAALGAFVHPLRLNFLEFFKNSGYEASGRNYNPLSCAEENKH